MRTAFIVLIWAAALCSGQGEFDAWERRMLDRAYDEAAAFALDLAVLHGENAVWAYRVAASLSMAGDRDRAVEWLSNAAERGYSGLRSVETDSDLEPVRSHTGFTAAAARVRANAERRLGAFREAAERAEPRVILPRGHDASKPTPLVIALHGTGGDGASMVRTWRTATQRAGAILVAPDALRPSGRGFAWTFRDESEWYVEHLIERMRARYEISDIVLAGFSQGANIALAMGRSHPGLADAVIPVCGHWEADVAAMPGPSEGEDDRPSWSLLIGERDPWAGTYDEAETALRAAGMRVEMIKVRGTGHAMPRASVLLRSLKWCLDDGETGSPDRPVRP